MVTDAILAPPAERSDRCARCGVAVDPVPPARPGAGPGWRDGAGSRVCQDGAEHEVASLRAVVARVAALLAAEHGVDAELAAVLAKDWSERGRPGGAATVREAARLIWERLGVTSPGAPVAG